MGLTASSLNYRVFSGHAMDLLSAARAGDKEYLQQALTEQPLLLVLANCKGTGLLHLAAQENHVGVLELLITLATTHAAALAAAVRCNCRKRQQPGQQQQQQQSKQQQDKVLKIGWNQLLAVAPCWPRSKRQLKLLMQPSQVLHTLVNWQNEKGLTPLMLACRGGHAAAVALLLEQGAEPLLLDKITRRSCLHYAAVAGHTACVNLLVNDWRQVQVVRGGRQQRVLLPEVQMRDGVTGTNRYIDVRTHTGFSALHFAAYWGHTGTVKALLTAGASVLLQTANGICGGVELTVSRGSNALHLAAGNGHMDTTVAMLQAHVETLAEIVLRPLAFAQQTTADATADNQQPAEQQQLHTQQQQQQQQRQQQRRRRLPWEGRTRLDPRSAVNSSGRTPEDVAALLRQTEDLQLLLHPDTPVLQALEMAGVTSAWLGVPTLAVLAKSILDNHLSLRLNTLEAHQLLHAVEPEQHQQQPATCSTGQLTVQTCFDGDKQKLDSAHEAAAADAITVHCGLTPAASCTSLQGSGDWAIDSTTSTSGGSGGTHTFTEIEVHVPSITCHCQSSVTGLSTGTPELSTSSASAPVREPSECLCEICFEAPCGVQVAGCKHGMCFTCARSVMTVTTSSRPALCPFCRQGISDFTAA